MKAEMPPVMILCGGKGTRLGNITRLTPKPMVKIGKEPIVRHIMNAYATFGCRRFILCLGYLKGAFYDYFKKREREMKRLGWEVSLIDTGASTATGGRVFRAAQALRDDDREFFLTYGDGVSDVNIAKLICKHRAAKRLITISAVHPISRFGEMIIRGDKVTGFHEKGVASYYINGGFMVVSRGFLSRFLTSDPKMFFEQKPMHEAAKRGQMTVYRHEGFWQCMDTPREHAYLTALWRSGKAPWVSTPAGGADLPTAGKQKLPVGRATSPAGVARK